MTRIILGVKIGFTVGLYKGDLFMPDYKKMYSVLCGAVDDVLVELYRIPLANTAADHLQQALEQAEEIYINTSIHIVDD